MGTLRERIMLLILVSANFYRSFARDIITPTQSLADGEKLVSAGGSFTLGYFSPRKTANRYVGIWYNKITEQTVVWVANREKPITSNTTSLIINSQGTLSITDQNSTVIWSMNSTTVKNPIAQLLDSGNFVVKDANSKSADSFSWQSFDYPTDSLLPGMKLGWNLQAHVSHNLTSWKSDSDPSPGPFSLAIDIRGGRELTQFDGSDQSWRSGLWNGIEFNGIPDLKTYGDFILTFVNSTDEVYASYRMANPSTIVRIIMNYTGRTERYIWIDSSNAWNLIWSTPDSRCDPYNSCGSYAICHSNSLPVCQCLPGFEPKFPDDWAKRDTSGGCIRKTDLDCANGADGFMKVSNVLLPDSLVAKIYAGMSLGECRANCLRNCSCAGYANSDVRNGGSGCVMWVSELNDIVQLGDTGQDLYYRLAAADIAAVPSTDKSHNKSKATIAIIVSLVLGALMLACISCCVWRKKEKWRRENLKEESIEDEDIELPLYGLDIVISATDNFSTENKLGEGGFGPVYKGKLRDGQDIAVKTLSKTSNQGIDEFKNEVLLIAKLQHRNLVRLLACCTQREERMLIYEYMPNKSLDALLFDKAKSINLDWRTRFHIIIGIARGLLYLHQDSRFRIIHRDLKASNVLLDSEMNPKISDFGLARIFGDDEAATRTRRVVGTYGYMSPEYAMDGIFSVKSDVFSYGVLALEIISGQRNKGVFLSEPHANLLGKAWNMWNEGKGMELIDPSIGSDFSYDEVRKCIKVGLLCVQENPEDRPTMSSVVLMLRDERDASFCEPQQPGFTGRRDLCHPSSTNGDSTSINDISLSIQLGR
ncbi:uncharacterized protein A4U43_C03F8910 [Asparagus officinalis]|uniref:Receptor-like serine/threonine-protein kinase n=1 Tax=Asparagus officinalis TaxID=4686 RepID=A0A5P1FCT7_ASPOF|nr:uncharacterized protein A4U43_C03F8910 [Asparagus officinalis]